MAATKPPLPSAPEPFQRISVPTGDGGAFDAVLKLASLAVTLRMAGPHAPNPMPQSPRDLARYQIREALLHLLEIGVIDIDVERLGVGRSWPAMREPGADS